MTGQPKIRFATDLCTFYDPAFWGGEGGYAGIGDLFTWGKWDELAFWTRIIDSVAAAGLDGIEITFGPGDWTSALRAYGTAAAFASEVRDRGLEVCSGFLSSRVPGTDRRLDLANPDDRNAYVDLAEQYAAFLGACGAEVMVTALGLRRTKLEGPPLFVDLKLAESIAETLNRMGAATARHGVTLALHPEAFTVFRDSRDADLFMLLTDPNYVALCPDTAQFTVAGSDPLDIVRRHRDRVVLTHWKDAVGPAPEGVTIDDNIFQTQIQWFAPVGQGVVDWPGWARLLRDLRYTGWAVFELDGAADPVADLKAIRTYVESSLGHLLA
ncbi:MAG: sugar phosphate isomerase/epimerase [Chloroflexia bacterium]|nr:sugar phosphate isomerase/epimerase [Chloroflexia bacterium]